MSSPTVGTDFSHITTIEEANITLAALYGNCPADADTRLATACATAKSLVESEPGASLQARVNLVAFLVNEYVYAQRRKDEAQAQAPVANAASEKQVAFARRLVDQKDIPADERSPYDAFLAHPESVTKRQAGSLIDGLLGYPDKAQAGGVEEDGMYRDGDGNIFKVQRSQAGRLYAKALVRDESKKSGWAFEYAAGAVRRLSPAMRMTVEQAREFGVATGTCCVCGRTLTDEESIEAGIGPVCAGKF